MSSRLASLIDRRADCSRSALGNVLGLVDDDRGLYSVAHILLELVRVSCLVVVVYTTTCYYTLLGFTRSEFLLSTL